MQKKVWAQNILATAALALPLLVTAPVKAALLNQAPSPPEQAAPSPAPTPNGEPAHFTKVIDDLPLMPGLELVEDEDVFFSAPGAGRIAETNAIGPVDVDEVYKFYRKSLPHLGWKVANARTYRREREELKIDAHANQKVTVVRFTIKPVSGS